MDSVAKHTAGPWTMDEHDKLNSARAYGIVRDIGPETDEPDSPRMTEVIAEVCDGPTAEADARLIAAAPTLAEALSTLIGTMCGDKPASDKYAGSLLAAIEAARAVLTTLAPAHPSPGLGRD